MAQSTDIFASAWPVGEETLWSVVNRGREDLAGAQLAVAGSDRRRYFDCYHGLPLSVTAGHVAFEVEAGGFGCVLATPNTTLSADTRALLATMKELTAGSKLNRFPKTWVALQQTMVPIQPTKPQPQPPQGMVAIPAVENYTFVALGLEIEGQTSDPNEPANPTGSSGSEGVDVQFPWESVRPLPSLSRTRPSTPASFRRW